VAVVGLIYLGCGLLCLPYYRYQINPDGISYISIAEKYAGGGFSDAVNGFWGPLISWLLAPVLHLGAEPLLAAKVLALVAGLAAIVGLAVLSGRFALAGNVRRVVLFTSIPVVLSFALSDITPDLILTCILLFYFAVVFSGDYPGRLCTGVLSGLLGAVAYLAKSFAFPFFVTHFFLVNLIRWLAAEKVNARRSIVRCTVLGYVSFAVVAGLWVAVISGKYGRFTFGTSGKVAYDSVTFTGVQGLGIYWQGFLEPPNETAISIWEDPSRMASPQRKQTGLLNRLDEQVKVTASLVAKIGMIFVKEFSVLSVVTGTAYLLFWLRKRALAKIPPEVLYPTITVLVYAGGYSLVTVPARYLWVLCLLSMLMGAYVLTRLFQGSFFTAPRRNLLLAVFCVSFTVPAIGNLREYANRNKGVYMLSRSLRPVVPAGSNLAANTGWAGGLYIAYHLDCRYYGIPRRDISAGQLREELERFGIEYYLVWGRGDFEASALSDCREITGGSVPGLRIYRLPKPG
jgi:hypothetical protein